MGWMMGLVLGGADARGDGCNTKSRLCGHGR